MIGIREVFCSKFQAMSKGSRNEFNRILISEGCKNYENPDKLDKISRKLVLFVQYFERPILITLLFIKSYKMSRLKAGHLANLGD